MKNHFFKNLHSQKGISLVEIVISAVLFSIAAVGMFSTFGIMRTSSNVTESRLQAAYYSRQVLEELRAKVDQRSWGAVGTDLTDGSHALTPTTIGNTTFTGNYTVTTEASGAKRVDLTISWTEPL